VHPLATVFRSSTGATTQDRSRSLPSIANRDRPNRQASWRLGRDSPLGFFRDAMNFDAFASLVLIPLGPCGTRKFRSSTYDIRAHQPKLSPPQNAPVDAILIADGLFLYLPQLLPLWDETVFVQADTCVARARTRNQESHSSSVSP